MDYFETVVTPEVGDTDDIDTIAGMPVDGMFILYAATGKTLTLKHGTGNIVTPHGQDISFGPSNFKGILILFLGNVYYPIGPYVLGTMSLEAADDYYTADEVDSGFQPLDGDLTDIAALNGTVLGNMIQSDGANWSVLKNNIAGGGTPGATDDETQGYGLHSTWISESGIFMCLDATEDGAEWVPLYTPPETVPDILVALSSNQNINANAYTTCQFNSVIRDISSEWDSTNYQFVCTVPGPYTACCAVYLDDLDDGEPLEPVILVDGTAVSLIRLRPGGADFISGAIAFANLNLSEGQVVKFQCYHNAADGQQVLIDFDNRTYGSIQWAGGISGNYNQHVIAGAYDTYTLSAVAAGDGTDDLFWKVGSTTIRQYDKSLGKYLATFAGTASYQDTFTNGGALVYYRNVYWNSPSPADNDQAVLSQMSYYDDAAAAVVVSQINSIVWDVSHGTVDAGTVFYTVGNGVAYYPYIDQVGVWHNACGAAGKEYHDEILPESVLEKLKTLHVGAYCGKNTPEHKRKYHIAPTAEDFWDAFRLGDDPRKSRKNKAGEETNHPGLAPSDMAGVNLIATKELADIVENKYAALEARIAALEKP